MAFQADAYQTDAFQQEAPAVLIRQKWATDLLSGKRVAIRSPSLERRIQEGWGIR